MGGVFGIAGQYASDVTKNLADGKGWSSLVQVSSWKDYVASGVGGAVGGGLGAWSSEYGTPILGGAIAGAAGGATRSLILHGLKDNRLPTPKEYLTDVTLGAISGGVADWLSGMASGVSGGKWFDLGNNLKPLTRVIGKNAQRYLWGSAAVGFFTDYITGLWGSVFGQDSSDQIPPESNCSAYTSNNAGSGVLPYQPIPNIVPTPTPR